MFETWHYPEARSIIWGQILSKKNVNLVHRMLNQFKGNTTWMNEVDFKKYHLEPNRENIPAYTVVKRILEAETGLLIETNYDDGDPVTEPSYTWTFRV